MAKILLVDDDALLVRMYQQKLQNDGYTVQTANDGEAALVQVGVFKPDLILLDIMMPKINGLLVLARLKENKETQNIPVILLTNVGSSDEDTNRGLELGAVAYLVKASNRPAAVVAKVKEILAGYVRELPRVYPVVNDPETEKKLQEKRKALAEVEQANKKIADAQKAAEEAKKKLASVS